VNTLADERLLVTAQVAGSAVETIEVSHEALIRHWERLTQWVEADRRFIAWQLRVNAAAKEWEGNKRSSDILLRGLPLTEAVDWRKKRLDDLSPVELEFVEASKQQKTRTLIAAATITGLVLMVIGGTTWLWQKGYDLDQAALKIESLVVSIHVPPKMTQIPGGSFQQGDVEKLGDTWRNPVRSVTIKPFAMGQYEVTFEEYDRFAIATGRRLPEDQGWGRGRRPVMNVSWDDAKVYTQWLSQETGKRYRLPSESEWEYAARQGAKQEVWAGTSKESELGDYAVFATNSGNRTAEVGTKQANGFGLHDLSGNIWEWVEDCMHGTYDDAPQDGSAWGEQNRGDCGRRVIRGGSWSFEQGYLRASYRSRYGTDTRTSTLGCRLVQDIP
jgi:formylglycine-generating enzyme required for sulfatase activity